jgi:hypothetical protein
VSPVTRAQLIAELMHLRAAAQEIMRRIDILAEQIQAAPDPRMQAEQKEPRR